MPHLISFTRRTSLVLSFPVLPGWACALQFNKHPYGSHLCLFLYLHSTVVEHLPVSRKESTTLRIYEGDIELKVHVNKFTCGNQRPIGKCTLGNLKHQHKCFFCLSYGVLWDWERTGQPLGQVVGTSTNLFWGKDYSLDVSWHISRPALLFHSER